MKFSEVFRNMLSSQSEKEQRREQYLSKMFPLGDEQIKWEDAVFSSLFKSKSKIQSVKYVSLIRREKYIDNNVDDSDKDYRKLLKQMKISNEEALLIEKVVKLEHQAKSIDELPSIEQLLEK